jgi:peroxiredoxin
MKTVVTAPRAARVKTGDIIASRELATIHGEVVFVPQPEDLVHLQFRRFAGCPICNLHLRSFTSRHDELLQAGIREVVVFHSSVEAMLEFQSELPFAAIADPTKSLYREFGVESSLRSMFNLPALRAAARAIPSSLKRRPSFKGFFGIGEEHFQYPGDFLIAPDGRVVAAKYGDHANDQWSVDEVISLAAAAT